MNLGLLRRRPFRARGQAVSMIRAFVTAIVVCAWGSEALAGAREQAYMIYSRINSVPPSEQKLATMAAKIDAGRAEEAAKDALNDDEGYFYSVTLIDLVSRWTNVEKTSRVSLNDYSATIIGMVRDDVAFNIVLSGDIVYVGDKSKLAQLPNYSYASNKHYEFIESAVAKGQVKLKDALVRQSQSGQPNALPSEAIAGVQSTRGFGEAYFKAGTNRRALKFVMSTYLCKEMEQLADSSRSDYRVRRDVSRAPGGDPQTYRSKCASCHAGMDGLAGAYAYYDMVPGKTPDSSAFTYSSEEVVGKFDQNTDQFPDGFITTDNSWVNNWTEGQNAAIGWHPRPNEGAESMRGGVGAKALGELLMATDSFAVCMAERSFKAMCLRAPISDKDHQILDRITNDFRKDNNLKNAMLTAVVACSVP